MEPSAQTIQLLATLVLGCAILITAYLNGRDILLTARYLLTGWRVRTLLACSFVAVSVYGVTRWHQTRGSIRETHAADEYRFELTSERDPDYEEYEGYVRDNIFVSVSRRDERVVERVGIGYVIDPTDPLTFTVRRLPNESLIVVTPP